MEDEDTGGYSTYHVGIIFASQFFAISSLSLNKYSETAGGHCSGSLLRFLALMRMDTACVPLVAFPVTTHFSILNLHQKSSLCSATATPPP